MIINSTSGETCLKKKKDTHTQISTSWHVPLRHFWLQHVVSQSATSVVFHSPHLCSFLPANHTQLVAWLTSPGLSAAAHLQSACIKTPPHSFSARLFFAFMTHFQPGKALCLLFPTTIFACVLPVSWLPVSTLAKLQEVPAKTVSSP